MSDHSQVIVDIDAAEHEAEALAEGLRAWLVSERIIQPAATGCVLGEDEGYAPGPRYLVAVDPGGSDDAFLRLRVNGLSFPTGRRVYDAGENGIELTCATCATTFTPGPEWFDSVGAWDGGDDDASYACPSCGRARRATEWRGPWPWGLGRLALEFWNWPPLSAEFVQEVARRLQHRTVLVRCHR